MEPIAFEQRPGLRVEEHAPLAPFMTFRLGGPARRLVQCETPEDLAWVLAQLRARAEPLLLLGGGSNLLVSDEGVDATVVRFVAGAPGIRREGTAVEATACTALDDLARFTVEAGLRGLDCCAGIPGTVGGGVVGNAGAWGRQVGDVLESVALLTPGGAVRETPAAELGFRYRHSRLKERDEVVLRARFRLEEDDAAKLLEERARMLAQRASRHPDLETQPCIGSIFRNIEPSSSAGRREAAGWFLERAGAKALRVGGARVFERHANIIVKEPGGTAQDVRDLAEAMRAAVRDAFGFELVREVRYLGRFRGEEARPACAFF